MLNKLKKIEHISEIYKDYDCFLIDLWGVMHDGTAVFKEAMTVVKKLTQENKRIVFLSNAPRPAKNVKNYLIKLKIEEKYLNNILTSGEAAIKSLQDNKFGKTFFHIGPARDEPIFYGLEKNKTDLKKCDFILCTGLFDEQLSDLSYYEDLLNNFKSKKLVCTNPDLTVYKAGKIEICAGAIANVFEKIGGKVIYFGKPHKEIYNLCLNKNEKTLVIGDNLKTDIKGANNLNLDSLFITNGVHRSEHNKDEDLIELLKNHGVEVNFFQKALCW
jgi:HAD superfamily hydrolase (TIGR01459 family)